MAFELDPNKETAVSLPNTAWVFITDVLRQMPYGNLVDADQQGLLVQMNAQIISSNQPETPTEAASEPTEPASEA